MPSVRLPDGGGHSLLLRQYGQEGFLGPEEVPEDVLEGVSQLSIRPDDVIILSYPKSTYHSPSPGARPPPTPPPPPPVFSFVAWSTC